MTETIYNLIIKNEKFKTYFKQANVRDIGVCVTNYDERRNHWLIRAGTSLFKAILKLSHDFLSSVRWWIWVLTNKCFVLCPKYLKRYVFTPRTFYYYLQCSYQWVEESSGLSRHVDELMNGSNPLGQLVSMNGCGESWSSFVQASSDDSRFFHFLCSKLINLGKCSPIFFKIVTRLISIKS